MAINADVTITPHSYQCDPQHRAAADLILAHHGIDKNDVAEIWIGAHQCVVYRRTILDLPPGFAVNQWATFGIPTPEENSDG